MEFLLCLYNVYAGLDQDADRKTESAVKDLHELTVEAKMKSMYTKETTGNGNTGHRGRKRASKGNRGHAGGGGGDDHAQLRAHGYEVEPEVFVDASGGEWAPIYKVPATLFYLFSMLTLDPRCRIIFSLCTDL